MPGYGTASLANLVAVNGTNGADVAAATYPGGYNGVFGSSQPYSFHTAGANVVFGDGRVQLINSSVSVPVFAALVTAAGAGQETIARGQY